MYVCVCRLLCRVLIMCIVSICLSIQLRNCFQTLPYLLQVHRTQFSFIVCELSRKIYLKSIDLLACISHRYSACLPACTSIYSIRTTVNLVEVHDKHIECVRRNRQEETTMQNQIFTWLRIFDWERAEDIVHAQTFIHPSI